MQLKVAPGDRRPGNLHREAERHCRGSRGFAQRVRSEVTGDKYHGFHGRFKKEKDAQDTQDAEAQGTAVLKKFYKKSGEITKGPWEFIQIPALSDTRSILVPGQTPSLVCQFGLWQGTKFR